MFTVVWQAEAEDTYGRLSARAQASLANRKKKGKAKASKDEGLFKQIHKTIQLLRNDPRHPSLRTHEYDSLPNPYDNSQKVFEAYAQNQTPGAYRVFWCYGPKSNNITIIAITPHP